MQESKQKCFMLKKYKKTNGNISVIVSSILLWLLYYIYKYKYNLMFSCFNSTREGTNKRHTLHI